MFVAGPLATHEGDEKAKLATRYAAVLDAEDPSLDVIVRHSRRAYPEIMLADDELWLELQEDSQANLALTRGIRSPRAGSTN